MAVLRRRGEAALTRPLLECPLCEWTGRDDERADARVQRHLHEEHPDATEETIGKAWAQREVDDLLGGRG